MGSLPAPSLKLLVLIFIIMFWALFCFLLSHFCEFVFIKTSTTLGFDYNAAASGPRTLQGSLTDDDALWTIIVSLHEWKTVQRL